MKFCCDELAENASKFEYASGTWSVCGEVYRVLSEVKFCPFCGTRLEPPKEQTI